MLVWRRLTVFWLSTLGILCGGPFVWAQSEAAGEPQEVIRLHADMTPAEVVGLLGNPNARRVTDAFEVWFYVDQVRLEFEEGRLVRGRGVEVVGGEVIQRTPGVVFDHRATPTAVAVEAPPSSPLRGLFSFNADRGQPKETEPTGVSAQIAERDAALEDATGAPVERFSDPEARAQATWWLLAGSILGRVFVVSLLMSMMMGVTRTRCGISMCVLLAAIDAVAFVVAGNVVLATTDFFDPRYIDEGASALVMALAIRSFTLARTFKKVIPIVLVVQGLDWVVWQLVEVPTHLELFLYFQ